MDAKQISNGIPVYKLFKLSEVKDVSSSTGDNMRLQFEISNEMIDRDGDSIDVAGWTLDNYQANPVFMWAHEYNRLPIGRSLKTYASGNSMNSLIEFTPDELYLDEKGNDTYKGIHGSTAYKFYANKFLNAVSAGFYPMKWEAMKSVGTGKPSGTGGTHFMGQDLIEVSGVPVPSNPGALAIRSGDDPELKAMKVELRRWAKETQAQCACNKTLTEEKCFQDILNDIAERTITGSYNEAMKGGPGSGPQGGRSGGSGGGRSNSDVPHSVPDKISNLADQRYQHYDNLQTSAISSTHFEIEATNDRNDAMVHADVFDRGDHYNVHETAYPAGWHEGDPEPDTVFNVPKSYPHKSLNDTELDIAERYLKQCGDIK